MKEKHFTLKQWEGTLEDLLAKAGTVFPEFQSPELRPQDILGKSPALRDAEDNARSAAMYEDNVFLSGETGTGKELFAILIHRLSPRGRVDPEFNKFVAVNCAAIPPELLETELFGQVKGAFTGAESREGAFETADGGTLFLDEVGELTPAHQAKLLRVLQPIGESPCQRKILPVGARKQRLVNVRVISATNRNLLEPAETGRFREDLYFRLVSLPIKLPPLRERGGDIDVFAEKFLRRFNEQYPNDKVLTTAALREVRNYSWPGNIRQLLAVLRQAAVFSRSREIGVADIKNALDSYATGSPDTVFSRSRGEGFKLPKRLREIKRAFINDAMKDSDNNQSEAAKLLGIRQQTISKELKKAP